MAQTAYPKHKYPLMTDCIMAAMGRSTVAPESIFNSFGSPRQAPRKPRAARTVAAMKQGRLAVSDKAISPRVKIGNPMKAGIKAVLLTRRVPK